MSADSVVIVGLGMMTSVGVSARETAASVRAATARFIAIPARDKQFRPFTIAEVPNDALPPLAGSLHDVNSLSDRERRLLRLATPPLRECFGPLTALPVTLALCLALPEQETMRRIDSAAFLSHLANQTGVPFDPAKSDAQHVGRAGGLLAIGQAILTIQAGLADFIIAGGVDSYRDLFVLGTLDKERRVKSESNLDGFIPGEAAGFLLLASARAAAAQRLPVLARVTPIVTGFEPGHLYSSELYRGDGLAMTFQHLVARGEVDAPIAEVYSSMTGESHWVKEWGVAFMRTRGAFREGHGMHHPADCFGETGAASGPLMVGLAALGINERYRRSPALAYGSSDRGARAAMVITA
ncbi:MAG TPA: beta-ketoacyl synthase N-terminal-like domain-containing protein [Gemmatimonadaceae bacterium]|jgi:3-oxoacyl-[acyl-carrier-protein] synthase-1